MIIGRSSCGHLAQCLPGTLFGGKTIQTKYAAARKGHAVFEEYMALARSDTLRHGPLPSLGHSGPEMPKQTYVQLDNAYWIEWHLLTRFQPRAAPRRLSGHSLQEVLGRYQARRQMGVGSRLGRRQNPPPVRTPSPSPPPTSFQVGWVPSPPPTPPQAPTWVTVAANERPTFVKPQTGSAAIAIRAPPSPGCGRTLKAGGKVTFHKRKGGAEEEEEVSEAPAVKKQR